jgi:hypothetical protein
MHSLTWPPFFFPRPCELRDKPSDHRGHTPVRDRDFYIDAGLVGGDSTITVTRQSPEDVGFREIFVSVDGEQIAMLRNGESVTHEVTPGAHRVRAHNTLFWKTHELLLKPGEHVRFTAINRAGFGTFGLLFFLGSMPVYLTFERSTGDALAPGRG